MTIYFILGNSSATKAQSHKEKILILKRYMKGKNSFLKNQMTFFLFASNFELSKHFSILVAELLSFC